MSEIQYLDVTYQAWKNARSFFGGTTNSYYISEPEGYILVLVNFNLSKSFVISCRLNVGTPDRVANITDFETTIKNLSIPQNSVDDCVVAALIGA